MDEHEIGFQVGERVRLRASTGLAFDSDDRTSTVRAIDGGRVLTAHGWFAAGGLQR